MKRGMKLASLFLISLFLVSFLLVVVSAAEGDWTYDEIVAGSEDPAATPAASSSSGGGAIAGALGNVYHRLFGGNPGEESKWMMGEGGQESTAKVLLTILIAIVVYSIFSTLPGFSRFGGFIGWIFSAIVGYLAMMYITPDEVLFMMTSYSGMGFALGMGIPFMILIYFTIGLGIDNAQNRPTEQVLKQILMYVIWGLFTLYIIYRLIALPTDASDWMVLGLLFLLILSAGILFAMGYLMGVLNEMMMRQVRNNSTNTMGNATVAVQNLSNVTTATGGAPQQVTATRIPGTRRLLSP